MAASTDGAALVTGALDSAIKGLTVSHPRSQVESPVLWVAFSGGLDSTVLLHAAVSKYGAVRAVHVNHGLQDAATEFESHCMAMADSLGIPLIVERVALESDAEAPARRARYAVFERVLGSDGILMLGHHRGDQAETWLLRSLQGRGHGSIPPVRRVGAGWALRPFLELSRETLAHYAVAHGLTWVEDPTNAHSDYDRNFIRNDVLPPLAHRWPAAEERLASVAHRNRHLSEGVAKLLWRQWGAGPVAVEQLQDLQPGQRAAMIGAWLSGIEGRAPANKQIDELVRQMAIANRASMQTASGRVHWYRRALHYEQLQIEALRGDRPDTRELTIGRRQRPLIGPRPLHMPVSIALSAGTLTVTMNASGFWSDGEVSIRVRAGGERIFDTARGIHITLKKLLNERGVPPWQRATYPLIYVDDRLVCVPGLALDARCRPGQSGRPGDLPDASAGVRSDPAKHAGSEAEGLADRYVADWQPHTYFP